MPRNNLGLIADSENLNFDLKRGFFRIQDVNRKFTSTTVCVLDMTVYSMKFPVTARNIIFRCEGHTVK